MELYLVRHGIAEPAAEAGSDADRKLAPEGRAVLTEIAQGLRALDVAPDRLFTSPLIRARQTAAILHAVLDSAAPEVLPALGLDALPEDLLDEATGAGERVMMVGHMPTLGELVSLAATGVGSGGTPLSPGGAAALEFSGRPRAGGARLAWLLTPTQLMRAAQKSG